MLNECQGNHRTEYEFVQSLNKAFSKLLPRRTGDRPDTAATHCGKAAMPLKHQRPDPLWLLWRKRGTNRRAVRQSTDRLAIKSRGR